MSIFFISGNYLAAKHPLNKKLLNVLFFATIKKIISVLPQTKQICLAISQACSDDNKQLKFWCLIITEQTIIN